MVERERQLSRPWCAEGSVNEDTHEHRFSVLEAEFYGACAVGKSAWGLSQRMVFIHVLA